MSAWPVRHPINWGADPYKDVNWRYCLHGLRMCDPIIREWFNAPERWRVEHVLEVFRSWAAYEAEMAQSRPSGEVARASPHGMVWHDMGSSIRAFKLAWLLDVGRQADLSEDDMSFLESQAALHAKHLSDPSQLSKSNHGFFQVSALGVLAFIRPESEWAANAIDVAKKHLKNLFSSQFTEEGIHREHSIGYHFFALKQMQKFPTLRRLGDDWKDRLEKASLNGRWMRRPNGSVIMIGDTDPTSKRPITEDPPGEIHGNFIVSQFHRSGYAAVRTKASVAPEESGMIFMTGMRWSGSHKNDDDLSFEWFDFGFPIIIDAGKYGYISDSFRRYAKRQIAHSVAGITAYDTSYRHLTHYGSAQNATQIDEDDFLLSGQVDHNEFRQERTIRWKPLKGLTITDALTSDNKQNYVSRLLFDKEVKVYGHADSVQFTLPNGRKGLLTCSHGPITLHRGEKNPVILGWQQTDKNSMAPTTCAAVQVDSAEVVIEWILDFDISPQRQFDTWLSSGGRGLFT